MTYSLRHIHRGLTLLYSKTAVKEEGVYKCLFYSPPHEKAKLLPLLVYVPGRGEIGSDLVRQFNQRSIFDVVTSEDFQSRHPCHLLALAPPMGIGSLLGGSREQPAPWQLAMQGIVKRLTLKKHPPFVDTNRVYVTGLTLLYSQIPTLRTCMRSNDIFTATYSPGSDPFVFQDRRQGRGRLQVSLLLAPA